MNKKEYNKEYQKEYHQRPDVIAKAKLYRQRPEVKAKDREYRNRPERKAKAKEYRKEYLQRPEVKAKIKEYRNRSEIKKYHKEYNQRSNVIGKRNDLKLQVIKKLGGKCNCCGVKEWWNLTVDHIKPVTDQKRYTNKIYKSIVDGNTDNLQLLCFGCNNNKNIRKKCQLDHSQNTRKKRNCE